jgi:asparagine synthase (glutamine-hydrolysing)
MSWSRFSSHLASTGCLLGGLAAHLSSSGSDDVRKIVSRMLAASPHRGERTSIHLIGACALGVSSRQEIGDSSLEWAPGLAVAFTGRLENAPELTKWLDRKGLHVASTTPAGLLLGLFSAAGDEAPNRLRGAFSAAVSDGHSLWFFRDQIGFETLFWRDDADGVYIASEAKQVVAGSRISMEPDVDVLQAIFYSDEEDHSRCALSGVKRVICSDLLRADRTGVDRKRYWQPDGLLETARLTDDETRQRFDELMEQACARTLTGDDAVALSGGIDSPAVAAFASKAHLEMTGQPLQAISAVYPDFPSADESSYIEDVAEFLDLPLHMYEPEPQRLDRLSEWVRLFDGPWSIWSPAGAEEQFRIAHALGVRTILTGELAEQVMAMQIGLIPHLLSRGRIRAAARQLRLQRSGGTPWRRIARQIGGTVVPRWVTAHDIRRRPLLAIPDWLDADRAASGRARHALAGRRYWATAQLAAFGDGSSLPLEAGSILQARDGVRIRQPWADVDLWEFFVSLPAERKFPDPQMKALVRRLLRGKVPDSIVDRKDKPALNEWFEATSIDYPSLRRWLLVPKYRVLGVDYKRLAGHLQAEDMDLASYIWAKDLAAMQAFLSLW